MTDKAISGTDSRENDRLLPCPFCGGEASKRLFYGCKYGIYCDACSARVGGLYGTEAEAIEAWNTRAGGVCAFAEPTDLTDCCSLLKERTCRAVMAASKIASTCSECGAMLANWAMRYCPNCGAKVVDE